MKPEDFMEAFQYLDDDIIEAADLIRRHPQPVKKRWPKYLATAACMGMIALAINQMDLLHFQGGADGIFKQTGDAVMEDKDPAMQGDGNLKDSGENYGETSTPEAAQKRAMLTLPDYSTWTNVTTDNADLAYYKGETDEEGKYTSGNTSSTNVYEGLICTADAFAVYTNLDIPSSYIEIEDMNFIEKELSQITDFEVYAYYLNINSEDARPLLNTGRYIAFHDEMPQENTDYDVKFIYLYDQESNLAVPYYHFYDADMELNDGESILFKGWYVPAIDEKYITNMPER